MSLTVSAFIAVLITGTYAWLQISSQVIVDRYGHGIKEYPFAGGTLHNDHQDDNDNHDIYVENWGTRPIYTRIRLREYMATGSENNLLSIEPNQDINKPETWGIHIPMSDDTPEICGSSTNPQSNFHTYWSWKMGGQKYYYPAPDDKRGTVTNDMSYVDSGSPPDLYAQSPDSIYGKHVSRTLNSEVLTMGQWISAGRPVGEYWVIDTDGWAYWADAIKPGAATGLLLDSASLVHNIQEYYHYMISVEAQMVTKANEDGTANDYTKFGSAEFFGWTENGRELMELITQNDISIIQNVNTDKLTSSLPIWDDMIYVRQGSSVDLGLKDTSTTPAAINIIPEHINGAQLTWLPECGVWNMYIDKTEKAFSTFTLSLEEKTTSASIKIAVIPNEASGVITGRGGIPILDYGNGSYRPIYENNNGVLYGGSWISGSDLQSDGFAIVSTLPIINDVVYLKQGQSFGLTVTGTSPGFDRIAGNFPFDNDYYSINEMLSLRSCTVTAKLGAPAGTRFNVKISQHAADGSRIGEQRSLVVVIIPADANGIITGKSGKVYICYDGGYRELNGDKLGPQIAKEQIQ